MGDSGRPVLRFEVYDTSSILFAGTTCSTNGEMSLGIPVWEYDKFALWVMVSATNGTTETLDLEFFTSENTTDGIDGDWTAIRRGTTASQTTAQMNQITTSTGAFISPLFELPASDSAWLATKFVITGTGTPGVDMETMYWILRKKITD